MLINSKSPHGGDIYSNKIALDFSSNVNPFGMPEDVRRAIIEAADGCSAYPDPYCRELRGSISRLENLPADMILCGSGAAELIYSFACSLPKDKPALIVSPSFCEYETALRAADIEAEHYILTEENGFRLTGDFLSFGLLRYGAVFICSPNNPTGITVGADLVRAAADSGTRLLLDLTFLDLTDEPRRYDVPALVRKHPGTVVLKAFTKSYAMAGVRLGYALCSDAEFLERMSEKTQCWNVSTLAQRAGIAAADCGEWLANTVREISRERARLTDELTALGVKVFPGEANYLLLYSEADLRGGLLKRGILIRGCSDYVGLKQGFVRAAVRTREENDRLLSAAAEILG